MDMLSLSDGKLPSLSVDAMGEFQTESFRCESGFQMLLGGQLLTWSCLKSWFVLPHDREADTAMLASSPA